MNRHGSMNDIFRLFWSVVRNVWIPVAARSARTRRAIVLQTGRGGAGTWRSIARSDAITARVTKHFKPEQMLGAVQKLVTVSHVMGRRGLS
jgi:hypothetical protein